MPHIYPLFSHHFNINVTRIQSNIYTNIIFIRMGVKLRFTPINIPNTVCLTEMHAIITQTSVIFIVSP